MKYDILFVHHSRIQRLQQSTNTRTKRTIWRDLSVYIHYCWKRTSLISKGNPGKMQALSLKLHNYHTLLAFFWISSLLASFCFCWARFFCFAALLYPWRWVWILEALVLLPDSLCWLLLSVKSWMIWITCMFVCISIYLGLHR